jgi:membrane protein implicated in regulation of membrane protease activity
LTIWPRIAGVVLFVVGVIWIGQGIGAIHGSFMTGQPVWAALGGVAVIAGAALMAWAAAMRRRRSDADE